MLAGPLSLPIDSSLLQLKKAVEQTEINMLFQKGSLFQLLPCCIQPPKSNTICQICSLLDRPGIIPCSHVLIIKIHDGKRKQILRVKKKVHETAALLCSTSMFLLVWVQKRTCMCTCAKRDCLCGKISSLFPPKQPTHDESDKTLVSAQ